MAILAALALALPLASTPAAGARPRVPPTPPDVAQKMSVLFTKASPDVRAWVDAEARKLRAVERPDVASVAADARQRFASAAPPLTPAQANVLAAMALYQAAKDLESLIVTRDRQRDPKHSLGEMSDRDLAELNRLMERKAQLEAMISNVLRASYDTGHAVVSTLKAS